MVTELVIFAMIVVALGFVALAFTDSAEFREAQPETRRLAVLLWWAILIIGWAVFAWIAFGTTTGLDGAATWVASRGLVMRVAMWLLLLPWIGALAVWQTPQLVESRVGLIIAIAALTFLLATQLYKRKIRRADRA